MAPNASFAAILIRIIGYPLSLSAICRHRAGAATARPQTPDLPPFNPQAS
jgi:hypothetical protein